MKFSHLARPVAGALALAACSMSLPAMAEECANPDALGVSRTIALDTTGGFKVGRMQYKRGLPLRENEVVLTFDDGPSNQTTPIILEALAKECAKATFFVVGSMVHAHPDTLRAVAAAGHTIGTHTYSHRLDLQKQPFEVGAEEIDRGIAEVTKVLGVPPAPFFRYPGLGQTKALSEKLSNANIGVFSGDAVGDDWIYFNGDKIRELVLQRLEAHKGGIILIHDIKHATAQMLPQLLVDLKERGFKLVHIVPASPAMLMADKPPAGIDEVYKVAEINPPVAPGTAVAAKAGQPRPVKVSHRTRAVAPAAPGAVVTAHAVPKTPAARPRVDPVRTNSITRAEPRPAMAAPMPLTPKAGASNSRTSAVAAVSSGSTPAATKASLPANAGAAEASSAGNPPPSTIRSRIGNLFSVFRRDKPATVPDATEKKL
jgi:peptidoglycan/xylan/chitin deacetylase (PgdA/CDA1 family)